MSLADVIAHDSPETLPLLRHSSLDAVLAYQQGRMITVRDFLKDVAHVAASLPNRSHVLNACTDRYHFAVGLASAILRRQISLLPPSHNPEMVRQMREIHPQVYCLSDQPPVAVDLPMWLYSARGEDGLPAEVAEPQIPAIYSAQVIACVFTSGSTGRPTEHVKCWGSLVRNVLAEARRLGVSARSGHCLVGTVPPQHMYGLESTVLLAWQSGAAMVAERPFYPADISATLSALPSPKVLVTTPFHLRTWLAESAEVPAVELIVSATASLSTQLALEAETRCGGHLLEVYGSTETGQLATRRSARSAEWLSFEGLNLVERDGQTWVSGGHVEAPLALSDVLALCEPVVAGDLSATRFILHGRSADMVNIAGKRTSLGYLNLQLNAIPGVIDGAFLWPEVDAAGSQGSVKRLAALVVAPELDPPRLLAALRQRIDPAFMPRPLHFVAALPRNATGKLPQAAIVELAQSLEVSALTTFLPLHIAPDHPAFAGHFPGHPIVPGVVLLDEALQALAGAEGLAPSALQVGVAKFLVPVRPGEALALNFRSTAPGRYAIEVRVGEGAARVAATATITFHALTDEGGA
ncbi:AMP-binding protein [Aquabacterium sp.]|uniref:AMP-binding protein n=1 Tax=Aquabacterium sp. TaxID=1872578 RepID=UPI0019AFDDED|nr:AMP-binding protein [Aquabacterium sp.]MBC7701083.1 AMP-binding protein [Aquabacterium sp.]